MWPPRLAPYHLQFISNAQLFWFSLNTSYNHGHHPASRFWLDPEDYKVVFSLVALPSRSLVEPAGWSHHHLSSSSRCTTLLSSHRCAAFSSSHCCAVPLILSLCRPSLPCHQLAVVHRRCHQTPSQGRRLRHWRSPN